MMYLVQLLFYINSTDIFRAKSKIRLPRMISILSPPSSIKPKLQPQQN